MMPCPDCGETLERSFGQWLHTRPGETLIAQLYCANGSLPPTKPALTPDPDPHKWPPFLWPANA